MAAIPLKEKRASKTPKKRSERYVLVKVRSTALEEPL